MFLADFHIHSTFSDGKWPIPRIVDLYGSHGFGAIAITDHLCESATWLGKAARYADRTLTPGTFPLYLEILKSEAARAWDRYRMVLIPGVEFTKNSWSNHRSAHLLGLGIDGFLSADLEIDDLIEGIQSAGGIAIAAHPVFTQRIEKQTYHLWNRREDLANKLDAWEVASGSSLFPEVIKSSLPKIANSDFHRLGHFASWKTMLSCERHPQAILEAICRQELSFKFFNEVKIHDLSELGPIHDLDPLGPVSVSRDLSYF